MNIQFFFNGLDTSAAAEDYITKRITERVEDLVDPVSRFDVEVSMDKKKKFRVEIMLHTPHKVYRAEEISESIEGSADMVMDEIKRQVVSDKNRMKDLKRSGGREFKEMLHSDLTEV